MAAREWIAARGRWVLLAVGTLVLLAAGVILLAEAGSPPEVEIRDLGNRPVVDWGEPDGKPRGVIILLPGGGWDPARAAFREQRENAANLRKRGYATAVVLYSRGPKALREVERIYKRARQRYRGLPICASGISSGGHLALMLATREPDLACVVDIAGPTDLTKLGKQGSSVGRKKAIRAFGKDELSKYSPVRDAHRIEANVLMVLAPNDPVNPVAQGAGLERALPSAEVFELDPDPDAARNPLFHLARVTPQSFAAAAKRILDFLDSQTERH